MIYLALYIDDLLVTVSTSLVKWIKAKSLECKDIVNNDTEIMRGGDYRSNSSYVVPQVSGFLNHSDLKHWQILKRSIVYLVGSMKSNQNFCQLTTSTNVPKRSKHEDVKYRYVQQTVQEKVVKALVTAVFSL